jgi:hypothetical protein
MMVSSSAPKVANRFTNRNMIDSYRNSGASPKLAEKESARGAGEAAEK